MNKSMNSPQLSQIPQHKDSNLLDIKEKLLDLDIVEEIGKHVQLKPAGANYKGFCPLHKEKTPSFTVFPGTNTWHCFGCGKGGNIIDFKIENDGLTFKETLVLLAKEHNITISSKDYTEEERKADLLKDSLFICNKIVSQYYQENLYKQENKKVLDYALSRWNYDTLKLFSIGYAPDQNDNLILFSRSRGLDTDTLKKAGLIKESKKRALSDFFQDRLIFPISDKFGNILAFSGRILPDPDQLTDRHKPKYLNTPDTIIYKKGNVLYGLDLALKSIKKKHFAYLVEGNPDVIRLQEININNVVASCGTGLTSIQVNLLKSLVKSVTIIGDSDTAGWKAVQRSAELMIEAGIIVNVVLFKEGEEKKDPDSYFTDENQFNEFVNDKNNNKDYIVLCANIAAAQESKEESPEFKVNVVNKLSALVCNYEDKDLINQYIELLGKVFPPKPVWKNKIESFQKKNVTAEKSERIPSTVNVNDFERYSFYEDHDGYYFRTKSGIVRGCNFVMKPLFHIQSVQNAKRLYEIKNEHGQTEVIELLQKDLVALQSFKIRVESLGNFLWEVSETELNKLKRYLYEKTETCIEITQLGWQKAGFYAWANGIYNDQFIKTDDYGIVKHNNKNYYLPALSSIYKGEEGLFMSERRFIHRDNNKVTLNDYSQQLIDVYGDNAMIALCFYFATLFRDYIVKINTFFPILNLFGPKGTGKTELAVSMMHFFGKGGKGPNMNNTTKAALADHVSQVSNALVHIDEYKNSVDYEKIEFLKGLWDGTGRTRMNMDKDKKKGNYCSRLRSYPERPGNAYS